MTAASEGAVHLEQLDDLQAVARRAAELFVERARAARTRGRFTVALSGGSTPRSLHTLLAGPDSRNQVDWTQVQFYWGDERYVPPDDPESNYRMARETLLDKLPEVRPQQIHRIPTELPDPGQVADLYEQELHREFALAAGALPRFDLIYLGLGPDAHTASLFPHTEALHVRERLVVANYVPKLASTRITMTAPVLNAAATVAFLVAGSDKAAALAAVLEGPRDPETYPAQLVQPAHGTLYWLVDRAAAAGLKAHQFE
jgi:6-phosphogluconolactonase